MTRTRILLLITLMLYAGPLVAGLAGYGWAAVWPFVAIFTLWQVVMRPADWPRDPARWSDPALLAAALARVALLTILVALCFAAGRGIGAAIGYPAGIPLAATLAASFVAVPLARMVHDPAKAAAIDALLEDALAQIGGKAPAAAGPMVPEVAALLDLPDDVDPAEIGPLLDALARHRPDGPAFGQLVEVLDSTLTARAGLRRGLVDWALQAEALPQRLALLTPAQAWSVVGLHDHPLQRRFLALAETALARHPAEAWAFPEASTLEMVVDSANPSDVNEALGRLAAMRRADEAVSAAPDP